MIAQRAVAHEKETGMAGPTSVEDYLASLPEDQRVALEKLRKTIRAAAPEATETISYQMPAFKNQGRFLVSYAAFKDHCSFFPASNAVMEALGEELKPYFSGKGTLRFTTDKPLPAALVKKIVKARIEENAARGRRWGDGARADQAGHRRTPRRAVPPVLGPFEGDRIKGHGINRHTRSSSMVCGYTPTRGARVDRFHQAGYEPTAPGCPVTRIGRGDPATPRASRRRDHPIERG